jgi:D-amino-acid dehydrogenase
LGQGNALRIAVIGTGIVGVCTAAWLQRDGQDVTYIDPGEAGEACSFGNAGSISPSACLPVGMPGMWRNVPKWLLDPDGPLTVRWRYLPVVMPWLVRFLRVSTRDEVVHIATAMRDLLSTVFESYEPITQHAGAADLIRKTGCLYVFSSRDSADRWKWAMDLRRSLGVDLRDVDSDQLAELEPDLKGRFQFGLFAPDNGSTLDPSALVKAIYRQSIQDGAEHIRAKVTGFDMADGMVRSVEMDGAENLAIDGVVLAAGAWSGSLARQLGVRVPLETQRGYHVTVENPNVNLNRTVMAVEHNIMVNPMAMGLRFAGTVELAGLSAPPRYSRAEGLLRTGKELFPALDTGSNPTGWAIAPVCPTACR